ncbi:MAG: lantibiotic leader peptide-processing serine protease [Gaiellaceae bacterium]|jgi:subtilisin family serine protease|nr:lantibiotic leader peptide-processing serine protease [Gaiellaceae bacterium]
MRSMIRRAALAFATLLVAAAFTPAALAETYVVLYKGGASTDKAGAWIQRSGGTVVANYRQIGVVVASSSSTTFVQAMQGGAGIETVAVSRAVAKVDTPEATPGDLPNSPATEDSLAALQWDMRQIHTPEAHAITGGSPAVVVGDIDTGLDKDHPDLVANIDFTRSVSCESGAPVTAPAAWDDHAGHGTHTAGTIAAASNGFGITGVAPRVKIAGIKSSNDDGYFFVHMVVCSFVWAAEHQIDVTNNSYFMDPYLHNCRTDPAQRALWKAAKRAIDYAQKQGVTVVASEGNQSDDLSHPQVDTTSPDYPPGIEEEREITNACVVVPVEVPGVIGVTAVGNTKQTDGDDDPNDYLKSYYSAYGISTADVAAPGGDFYYGRGTDGGPFGLVLSTWPADVGCGRSVTNAGAMYCYLQGTSMASPHAAGVAALIVSRYGNSNTPQNGKMRPGAVEALLQQTADSQPCPTALPLTGAPGSSRANLPYSGIRRPSGDLQECQGGPSHNSWYGAGQINALRAVTK